MKKHGRLIRERDYLIVKSRFGPDVAHTAPKGSAVLWDSDKHVDKYADYDGTNSRHLDSYGGRLLHWIDLPEFGSGASIGAELGADFEWIDERSERE